MCRAGFTDLSHAGVPAVRLGCAESALHTLAGDVLKFIAKSFERAARSWDALFLRMLLLMLMIIAHTL